MSLKQRLKERIGQDGPMNVAEYMTLCLLDPVDGYYPTRDPLGSDGDFITAPEISQMFGEVLGLWAIQSWRDIGAPARVNLIELGPGRGIMMSDILRTAQLDPDFFKAVHVTLIEASAALESVQGQTLGACGVPVSWVPNLESAPHGPSIIIGNEFLDCLPIRQFIQTDRFAGTKGWHERMVMLDDNGDLAYGTSPVPINETLQSQLPVGHDAAKTDDLIEICPAYLNILDQFHARFEEHSGRALFIDYGPDVTEFGDTLQALKRHEKVGVFSAPGDTDLTARVNFAALGNIADSLGLASFAPVTQRTFLSKLGIEVRAVALSRAKPDARPKILRQLHRLMDDQEMGTLFKAVCFGPSDMESALGF